MARKITVEQIRAILADVERRLTAGKHLSTQDFEEGIKAGGCSYKEAEQLIVKHGSAYLVTKYKESFGNHLPSELKER